VAPMQRAGECKLRLMPGLTTPRQPGTCWFAGGGGVARAHRACSWYSAPSDGQPASVRLELLRQTARQTLAVCRIVHRLGAVGCWPWPGWQGPPMFFLAAVISYSNRIKQELDGGAGGNLGGIWSCERPSGRWRWPKGSVAAGQ